MAGNGDTEQYITKKTQQSEGGVGWVGLQGTDRTIINEEEKTSCTVVESWNENILVGYICLQGGICDSQNLNE